MLGAGLLAAAEHSGSVRAADQFIPGATVTARQGGARLVAYTNESGRYRLDLTPGVWDIQIEMFGFAPLNGRVQMGSEPVNRDWTLEMPRPGQPAAPVTAVATPVTAAAPGKTPPVPTPEPKKDVAPAASPANATARPAYAQRWRPGQGPPTANAQQRPGGRNPQQPGFQNMSVTATEEGEQALAAAEADPPLADLATGDSSESYVVNGSMSGGLAAAADEQVRRNRLNGRGGGQGGLGGQGAGGGLSGLAALSAGVPGGDPMGLNSFGAAGVNSGFGDGMGGSTGLGNPGFGGPGGGGPGGGGRGGGGGGGGGGRGGGGGGRGGRGAANNRRGPNNGAFASFGNRRRDRPTYSGSVNFTGRNSVLDARPFSLTGQDAAKPSYAQNNFGFNFGGPLRIPKIVSSDSSTVYFTYQGSRSRSPYNGVSTMPGAAERAGDFSQAMLASGPVTIYDPLSGAPFPGNAIPVARFNPASAALLKYLPLPSYQQLAVQNYQFVSASKSHSDNFGARYNQPLSRKDRLNFNFNYQKQDGSSPTLLGFRDSSEGSGLSSQAGWSHSFAPRCNSNLNWNFSRSISTALPYFAYSTNVAAALGIVGTAQDPVNYGPPNLSFTNFGGLSDGSASVNRNQTSNITEAITLVRRKHNLTFGVGYRRLQQNPLSYANSRGSFSFSGLLTSGFYAKGNPLPGTGFDFADFLLGLPQSSSLQFGSKSDYFRSWSINGYAQDDFRVRPNLTFNLGLRY